MITHGDGHGPYNIVKNPNARAHHPPTKIAKRNRMRQTSPTNTEVCPRHWASQVPLQSTHTAALSIPLSVETVTSSHSRIHTRGLLDTPLLPPLSRGFRSTDFTKQKKGLLSVGSHHLKPIKRAGAKKKNTRYYCTTFDKRRLTDGVELRVDLAVEVRQVRANRVARHEAHHSPHDQQHDQGLPKDELHAVSGRAGAENASERRFETFHRHARPNANDCKKNCFALDWLIDLQTV